MSGCDHPRCADGMHEEGCPILEADNREAELDTIRDRLDRLEKLVEARKENAMTTHNHDERRISIENGKYTAFIPAGDYRIHVLRYGEEWLVIEQGSNPIASMMSEIVESRELIDVVMKWAGHGEPDATFAGHKHGNLYEAIARFRSIRGLGGEPATPSEAGALTSEQILQGLANLGISADCGLHVGLFYTGHAIGSCVCVKAAQS